MKWTRRGAVLGSSLFATAALLVLVMSSMATPAQAASRHPEARPRLASDSDQTWGGYAVTGSGPYTSISGSWNVPSLNCSKGSGDVSPWIGIDGWANDTVEQIGVDLDCYGGKASYHPWVEMYPANSVYFKDTINAGDVLDASVTVDGSSWILKESDPDSGWTKTFDETSSDQLASAEAIVESVGNSKVPPVPDFGKVTFTNISVNGSPFASAGKVHETTLQRGTIVLARDSALKVTKFSITWLHN
jgi:Peptidase A4 family